MKEDVVASIYLTKTATKWVVAGMAFCLAASAAWGVGSIISSFRLSGYTDPYANGIYAGPQFLSVLFCTSGSDYVYRYQPNGKFVRSYALNASGTPRGGDAAHLGNGYLSFVDRERSRVYIYRARGGNPVASFAVTAPRGGQLQDLMWTGTYYEVADHLSNGRFNRYTSNGSFVGAVTYNGWPSAMTSTGAVTYTNSAAGQSGAYLVASSRTNGQPSCILTTTGSGSLVNTFSMPSYFASGSSCGRSSKPARYGTVYWATWITASAIWCYEVDVEGTTTAVRPTTLGQIKTLYR
ncbi:MAG: hypothetical protein JSU81_10440 [Candidatus Coatesbacteria bacterium]|nr:MAG: hypothetical protein JSU81_10440 [Candidatus Coatesbacteria bacterium]